VGASGPKRAAVYHKPPVGVRAMETLRWLTVLGCVVILFAGIYLFHKSRGSIAALGLPVALVVFVGVICLVKAMGAKAAAFADRAVDAGHGATAADAAGKLLGELPPGFSAVHDFVSGRGNIEHIVVSPKGILTIETKSHKGIVSCAGEMLQRDGLPLEKDFIKQAWGHAYCVRDFLESHGIRAPRPQPVLLFIHADVQIRRPVRGVEIIGARYFPVFLKRLSNRMDTKEADKIAEVLKTSQAQMFV
jgi:hypothetical protein